VDTIQPSVNNSDTNASANGHELDNSLMWITLLTLMYYTVDNGLTITYIVLSKLTKTGYLGYFSTTDKCQVNKCTIN